MTPILPVDTRFTIGPRWARSACAPFATVLAFALIAATTGCSTTSRGGDELTVREITPHFLLALDAHDPAVTADAHGRVAITWISQTPGGKDVWLAVSRDGGETFAAPSRINVATGRAVSFGEGRPATVIGPDGTIAVAWSEQRADTSHAVDLVVRSSPDLGATFGRVVTINDDAAGPPRDLGWRSRLRWIRTHNPRAFHGFPSLAFVADGALLAAWLDDRNGAGPSDSLPSTLYASVSLDGGQTWSANAPVSSRACPCCRPDVAAGPNDVVAVAYRAGAESVRDPALAISIDGGRSFVRDTLISTDGWVAAECPTQGPRLVWDGVRGGRYVWFTGADPAGVYVMPWRADAGPGGLRRAIDDSVSRARRPTTATLGDAVLVGVEATAPRDSAVSVFAVRTLDASGRLSRWTLLGANASSGWLTAAGPRRALGCWVEREGGTSRIRLVQILRRVHPDA